MKIDQTREGDVTVVGIEGVIQLGESARRLSEHLQGLLDEGAEKVLLDLSAIDYVDSTGLGELVGYLQRFSEQGRRLALLNPRARILGLLRLTRLDEVFPIFEDRAEAVEALSG